MTAYLFVYYVSLVFLSGLTYFCLEASHLV